MKKWKGEKVEKREVVVESKLFRFSLFRFFTYNLALVKREIKAADVETESVFTDEIAPAARNLGIASASSSDRKIKSKYQLARNLGGG